MAEPNCKLMAFEGDGTYLYHARCPRDWTEKQVIGLVKSKLPPPWKPVNYLPILGNADAGGGLSFWEVRVLLDEEKENIGPASGPPEAYFSPRGVAVGCLILFLAMALSASLTALAFLLARKLT